MIALPVELTHDHAGACMRSIVKAVLDEPGEAVVADATGLMRFDSSALAVLLECRRQAQSRQKTFAVMALPPRLRDLAGLYGVDELLPQAD